MRNKSYKGLSNGAKSVLLWCIKNLSKSAAYFPEAFLDA